MQVKEKCDYCGQKGVEVDCTGSTCCDECWQDMKDWTPENQAELEELSKQTCAWLDKEIPKIKEENGLPPDVRCMVCTRCRKIVQSEDGLLYCDCHDERKGINPDEPE
jgi:hypothetical protein